MAGAPPAPVARLTSVVVLATRSRTKTLATPSSSSAERLSAPDRKTTRLPSPEMSGVNAAALAAAPPGPVARLTSVVVLATRSRTKMLATPLSSSAERLLAPDWKTTRRPSPEMLGVKEPAMAGRAPGAGRAADERGRGGDEVAHEDVGDAVVVVGREVVGARLEDDAVAVARDVGVERSRRWRRAPPTPARG